MRKIISVAAISAVIITLFVPWFYASGAVLTWTQTTQAEFNAGVLVDVDTARNPDDVELATGVVGADLTIDGGPATLGGDYYYDNVSIINGGTLQVQSGQILRIYAKDIYIDSSSSITADATGYPGGDRNYTQGVANDGTSTGGGAGGYANPTADGPGGGGAGYGGDGGDGGGAWDGNDYPGAGGAAYGNDSDLSIYMGSGGGAGGASQWGPGTYGGAGGQGGGAILLDAETIDIEGAVSASGGDGEAGLGAGLADGGGGGGGSGGTILINGETVTITGTVTASGGDGGPRGPENSYGGAGGGGGGGRIKVFSESLSDGTASYSAAGGNNGGPSSSLPDAQDGQAGTTYKGTISYAPAFYVSSGTLASQVLNTLTAGSTWDELSWNETLPANTDITFEVRADDSSFAAIDASPTWTPLSPANSPITTGLPSGQYMQWRATLLTTDTSQTPVLEDVTITYNTGMPSGGSDSDTYYPDNDVTVSATSLPVATDVHVYVVDDYTWSDLDPIPADVGDGMDIITTDGAGSITGAVIWTHPLTIGDYDIVFDINRDGFYNAGSDFVDDPGHPGFVVMAAPPPPPPAQSVGGEVYPIDKAALLLPWLGLGIAMVLAAGGLILVRRRS